MISTPSLLLPSIGPDTAQVVALLALFAAGLTLFEYASNYPSLVEFRDAPPFNRVRFLSLFLTVFLLTILCRGMTEVSSLTIFVQAIGNLIGDAIDFPYSPVRLVLVALPESVSAAHLELVRAAAGIAYLTSLLSLAIFVILLRVWGWPVRSGVFNVWVNLPTFDPTVGGDVVERLNRDARLNICLGFLLPFLMPAVAKAAAMVFNPVALEAHQTLIWTMATWAFLPSSLFMRGIAMGRIASMIEEKRRRTAENGEGAEEKRKKLDPDLIPA
ncbi:hypothetical protein [Harenicola maris]|uniref:hypothetical protein n=1 Tax=Harenicola maris TaxID=2841044 RepID=UPI002E16EAF9